MNIPIISVIIPCYNAALFLRICLDSLITQDLQEWEAIVIDDGSKDDTAKIGKEYAQKDSRIKFISKLNEGVSITRNRALKMVQGKYVFFLDSDDYLLTNDILHVMVVEMEKKSLDYIRFEYIAVDKDNKILFENKNKYLSLKWNGKIIKPTEYLNEIALPRNEFYLCLCMFRSSIIKSYDLSFIPNCRYREDADFIFRYLGHCNKVMYLTTAYYAYRKHEAAATVGNRDYSCDIRMLLTSLSEYQKECKDIEYYKLIESFKKILVAKPSFVKRLNGIYNKIRRECLYMLYH